MNTAKSQASETGNLIGALPGSLLYAALVATSVVSILSTQPAFAQSPDEEEAVKICERKEWRTKGCQALKESITRADKAEAKADRSEADRDHYREIGSKNDQVYSFLVDRGAIRPDPQKKTVPYDATNIGRTAAWLAAESGKLPKDDPARGISSLLLTAYKSRIDPKFAPAIP